MNHGLVEMFCKKLDSLSISDYYGLNSPGLTCYLNSVLQVLFMTEDFREAVKRCICRDLTTIDPHLGRLFADLQTSVAKTHNLTKTLGIANVYEQRDAAEYFEKILCLTSPEAAKMFKGELNHKTTCLKCADRNDSRNFFWILPLAVEDLHGQTYTVEKGLKALLKGEKVCGDNKMYCKRCNEKQEADFGCEITQNPDVLTLLLKRFSFDSRRRRYVKLRCKVDVPQTLHMESCKYDLYALVNHFGNLTGGHYTAHIKSFETQVWYHFNDDTVERVRQPLFGAGDKSLRSCTAYLLMYRRVSRNSEKTDEGEWEALFTRSSVESEGKRDEAERGKAPVPHHHLKDESCNTRENLKHLNGDVLKMSHDNMVLKKVTNFSRELEKQLNQRVACVSPHKKMLLQTDSAADGDKPSLQKSNSAKLQKDGGQIGREPNRHQLDTNTKEHMWLLNTGGTPRETHYGDCMLEQKHESQKNRLKTSETVWETQNNIVTGRTRVKPAETKAVKKEADERIEGKSKQRRESDVSENVCHSDVKPFRVSSNGYSSSSVPHWTRHSQSQFHTNELIGYNCSPNLCTKSNSSERHKEKMQRVVTADSSCKLETTHTVTKGQRPPSHTKKRNPTKSTGKRPAWR